MKDERLVSALDAQLPDEEARARMWAAVSKAWDEIAAEKVADQADEVSEAESGKPRETGFVVTAGGQASAKRARKYSWKWSVAAAVLVVAIGVGVVVMNSGEDPSGPPIIIPDDPTPGGSGTDNPIPMDERDEVIWNGGRYACAQDEPLEASQVGDRLGEGTTVPDAQETVRKVEIYAAKGKYATGSYIVVKMDSVYYLYLAK